MSEERLIKWVNTFQTFDEAFEILDERVDCGGFETADGFKQESALIQSFHAIKGLSFVVSGVAAGRPMNLMGLADEEREALPGDFMYALRSAQLVQADNLLGGDQTTIEGQTLRKRRAGIVEEAVGETMRKYRALPTPSAGPGIRQSLDHRAISALAGWLYDSVRVARA